MKVKDEPVTTNQSDLKIAWRYQEMPSHRDIQHANQFDFSCCISDREIAENNLGAQMIDIVKLKDITNHVLQIGNSKDSSRIVFKNLNAVGYNSKENEISSFLFSLKSALRKNQSSVAMITIDPRTLSNAGRRRIHSLCDAVISLTAFNGADSKYPDYDGTVNICKLPKVNLLNVTKKLETLELGFAMKKNNRYFVIDKLCLPPELGDTPSRTTCSTTKKVLDF